jgi:hypothetical protein
MSDISDEVMGLLNDIIAEDNWSDPFWEACGRAADRGAPEVTFTVADAGEHFGAKPTTVTVRLGQAAALNLIAVARQVDALLEWDADADTFERSMVAALDGASQRSLDSILAEMRSWAEDESHLLVWDRDQKRFAVCPDPSVLTPRKEV